MAKTSFKPIYPTALELISQTFQILRLKFPQLAQIYLLPAVVSSIVLSLYNATFHPQFDSFPHILQSILTPWFALVFLVALFISLWSQIALIFCVSRLKENISIKTAYHSTIRFIPQFFVLNLIIVVAIAAGSVILLVPGIYLSLVFSLSSIILVAENTTFQKALSRSYRLTSSHLRGYLGRIVTFGLLIFFVMFLFNLGLSILNNDIITSIFDVFTNMFIAIFGVIFSYLNYLYLSSFYPKSN